MTKPRKRVVISSSIALFVALIAYLAVFAPATLMIATGHYRLGNFNEFNEPNGAMCGALRPECGYCEGRLVEGECWVHRTGIYRFLK